MEVREQQLRKSSDFGHANGLGRRHDLSRRNAKWHKRGLDHVRQFSRLG